MSALLLLAALAGPVAAQSPCDDRALIDGPLMIGFGQGDSGVFRRACPRSELALGGGGRAIIEEADFYARLRGNGRLDFSLQPFDALELAVALEPVFYEQVIQSFRASHLGLGDTSVSATLLGYTSEQLAVSLFLRGTLPTAFGYYRNALPFVLDTGVLSTFALIDDVRLHGGLLIMGSAALTRADWDPRAALAGNVGADFVLFDWLSLVGDVNAQILERGAVDRLSLGLGVRAAWSDFSAELGAALPVAGDERHLASALLRLAWRFW